MQTSELVKLVADCKTVNRYVDCVDGHVYNVFGVCEDCLLVHLCYFKEGELWYRSLSQLPYGEVVGIVEREAILDNNGEAIHVELFPNLPPKVKQTEPSNNLGKMSQVGDKPHTINPTNMEKLAALVTVYPLTLSQAIPEKFVVTALAIQDYLVGTNSESTIWNDDISRALVFDSRKEAMEFMTQCGECSNEYRIFKLKLTI